MNDTGNWRVSDLDRDERAGLYEFAEKWLKRPLTPEEKRQLEVFSRGRTHQSAAVHEPLANAAQDRAPSTVVQLNNPALQHQDASSNMGTMQIFELDSTPSTLPTPVAQAGVADELAALQRILDAYFKVDVGDIGSRRS